jgi:hypothetical protein
MSKKITKLCKWDSGKYGKNIKKISGLVLPATYLCEKCGRVASKKNLVCKPVKL